jgi:FkbM family methyltransferase
MAFFPYRWLWHYSHALEMRLQLLDELHRLRAAGKRLPRGTAARIWKCPADTEDWIHLACFLDPADELLLLDVGANVGNFTSDFLDVFANSAVEAFEPVAETFTRLKARFREDRRVKTHNCALSSLDGERAIAVADVDTYSSFERYTTDAARAEARHTRPQMTDCRRLDGFQFATEGRTVVLKVDVQGHEIEVLKGARNTLQCVDVCLIETSFANQFKEMRPSFPGVTRMLEEADLFPVIFQEFGRGSSAYAFERDVVFVKRNLLRKIWFNNY